MGDEQVGTDLGWTQDRRDLVALLSDVHPDAADLYSHAIDALSASPLTRPGLMLGSHCMRELVPTIVEAQSLAVPRRSADTKAASDLAKAWVRFELRLDADDSEIDMADETLRPVPHTVYVAARATAAAGQAGSQNSRVLTALLATGQDVEINTASLKRLHAAIERFRSWTHHRDYTQPLDPVPPIAEIASALSVVEEALVTRFANRGDRVTALRAQLAQFNRRVEEATSG